MAYIEPCDVKSPRSRWKLIAVLADGGPGEVAYAIGYWDGKPRMGMRWNGTDDKPVGNPQSTGHPTWTMLDQKIHLAVIQNLCDENKQVRAREHLGIRAHPIVEFHVLRHPSGCYTLKQRVSGQREPEDSNTNRLRGNSDKADFLAALYDDLKEHLRVETRVVLCDLPE